MAIGFGRRNEEKEEKEEVAIEDLNQELKDMIEYLRLDEDHHKNLVKLEEDILEELVKIHNRLLLLEEKVKERDKMMDSCGGLAQDYPKKSLKILDKIGEGDMEILREKKEIIDEISKHSLQDVSKIYKEKELSDEEVKNIRILANILSSKVNNLTSKIHQDYMNQGLENIRRKIYAMHPGLNS